MFPLGAGSHASRPLSTYCFKEQFCIERRSSFEHDVHGATEFLCDDGQRLGFSVFADQSLVVALGLFITAEEEAGCLATMPISGGRFRSLSFFPFYVYPLTRERTSPAVRRR